MPVTTLDANAALVLVDLQKGILALPTVHPAGEILKRGARLADAFRERGLPVVLVRVVGSAPGRAQAPARAGRPPAGFADLAPELGPRDDDIVVTKHSWGAFFGTDLDLQLRRRGVTQVVLAGIATSMGVESTARAAHEHGYHVTVVTDAVTDMDPDVHRNSLEKVFPRLAETGTTEDVIELLG
ncbi:isochorismatase family protein [Streptomyces sp. ISL-11]|uniref:isochorismatase family protein n=1 Tax=Streptomyces sp. ISL-11 TaxID=2819174 RepID=UPI001BED13B8|nr:isochorismatase family protein [Streptomyces sp. ISL-11]MBT2383442.1 isochorismatase family protein [Streptomyces sp. ISL-11]